MATVTGPSITGMEKTKKALALQRTALIRIYDKLKEDFSKEKCDILEIQSSIKVLDEIMLQVSELNQLMIDIMLDAGEEEANMNAEVQLMNTMSSQYHKIKCSFDKLICQSSVSKKSESRSKLKIPKLQFRQFGGETKDWLGFWNQFSRIDEDSDIEEEDKLQYLVQATTPGSRARQIVESYPASKGNYVKAVDSLKQRFGREDLLIEVYVRELLKLVLMNLNTKNKLSTFFDKIESQLRALESLGVKSDTCAAMLYPLVESCLGEDLIRAWHRSQFYSSECSLKKRLDALMNFLREEVMNEDRIHLAVSSFKDRRKPEDRSIRTSSNVPTASELYNKGVPRCVFCKNSHSTDQCKEVLKLSFAERKQKLSENACCHLCTKFGHIARRCRSREKCHRCQGRHCVIMCPKNDVESSSSSNDRNLKQPNLKIDEHSLSNHTFPEIFLQTIVVELKGDKEYRRVRLLIDTGSHKSYITRKIAEEMGYPPVREEQLVHSLFGGTQTESVSHRCFRISLQSLTEDYCCNFEVLDQPLICNHVSSVKKGPWLDELKRMGVEITDTTDGPIDVLVGADIAGKLFSGRKQDLDCGLVAVHTLLGWTLMGKLKSEYSSKTSLLVTSMFSKNVAICDLWNLDVLGIQAPERSESQREQEKLVMEHFLATVKRRDDRRYEVCMPWIEGHSPLSSNFDLSYKRLLHTVKKLKRDNFYNVYDNVFDNWLAEGVIECSSENEPLETSSQSGHFLPHHPVYKPSSTTTPVRPVFDASSGAKNQPSLNQCLEKGINLIELIPSMILRFRLDKIGITADIRKAFLQIGLQENDRNFLKFLWYDKNGKIKIYRHARVVFGVTCSPFLLGAVLEFHLQETLRESIHEENSYSPEVISKLLKSFYVDNILISVQNEEALNQFIEQSTKILADRKFELRGWEHSLPENVEVEAKSNILGLIWNRKLDTLELSLEWFDKMDVGLITKRTILSAAHKLFDPIGFSCPVTLIPKILLQRTWSTKLGWDLEVDEVVQELFLKWLQELPYLTSVKIPRWISLDSTILTTQSVHVFCDASADAYAAYWYHVPGDMNPADLPSLGCSAKSLADGRWWEGPKWLCDPISQWPSQNFDSNEEEINCERRKTVVSSLPVSKDFVWYYKYFSKFSKIVKMVTWIKRFVNNSRKKNTEDSKFLTVDELEVSRKLVIRFIQEESFESVEDPKLSSLCPFTDNQGLIRLRTKISDRTDAEDFRMPFVLPTNHEVVKRLIFEEHIKNNHVGVQELMSILRANYWILKSRRTIRSVISSCISCKRFRCKLLKCPAISLPEKKSDNHTKGEGEQLSKRLLTRDPVVRTRSGRPVKVPERFEH
ncbi:uncharacterized protein LOC123311641 [Coccinella septempunctata]|uniref:uncharacterized protein LOC123311641 n=1 Tax=Coccinella septempunctata TaxID=41139 RepID=UPI001D07F884|nr:uncharacterized protein LOC123311641 [Coccinella septempunctata]